MFRLIYECIYKVVYYAAWSLANSTVSMLFLFAVLMLWREPEPSVILLCLLLVLFFISAILFVYATTYHMVHPNSVNFFREMPRKIPRIFSFSFSSSDILLVGVVLYLCGSMMIYTYNYAWQKEIEQAQFMSAGDANYFLKIGYLLVYYSSMALTFMVAVLFVFFWMYFFRLLIKIPAFVSDRYINRQEAVALTKAYRWEILLISGLINGSLSGINNIFISASGWHSAALATVIYWVYMHFNIALCVVFYQEYTAGYAMRKYK